MDDIKLLTKGREHDVYSIHYSTEELLHPQYAVYPS